jgi:hypothetical protein
LHVNSTLLKDYRQIAVLVDSPLAHYLAFLVLQAEMLMSTLRVAQECTAWSLWPWHRLTLIHIEWWSGGAGVV